MSAAEPRPLSWCVHCGIEIQRERFMPGIGYGGSIWFDPTKAENEPDIYCNDRDGQTHEAVR